MNTRFFRILSFINAAGLLSALLFTPFAAAGDTTYPYLKISPSKPVTGDSVVVQVVLGSLCGIIYTYSTSFSSDTDTVQCFMAPCWVLHNITINYTKTDSLFPVMPPCIFENPPCDCRHEYGPVFKLGRLPTGSYPVIDGGKQIGRFLVSPRIVSGTVTNDPYPLKIMSKPIANASVYLKVDRWSLAKRDIPNEVSAPVPDFRIIDSTTTDINGNYSFDAVFDYPTSVGFAATGYVSRTISFQPQPRNVISAALLAVGAHASIKGNVDAHGNCTYINGTPLCTGALMPVEGCTVTVPVPNFSITFTTITDKTGAFSIDSVPLVQNGETFFITASAGPEYSIGQQNVALSNTQAATINFNLEISYTNRAVKTSDSLSFTISTDKKEYLPGDSIRVKYTVQNTSNHTITFMYTPGCQYDLMLQGLKGDTLYRLSKNKACPAMIAYDSLAAGKTISTQFTGVAATKFMDSIVTVTANTFSFINSAVPVTINIKKQTVPVFHSYAEKTTPTPMNLTVSDSKLRIIQLAGERMSIALYTLSGRKIVQVIDRQYLSAGEHIVQLPARRFPNGMCIIRVSGETFKETRMIKNLK
jgi:hypothetical protein